MPILEVHGLRKQFGADAEILRGIDFSLEEGETLAVIGSSGSGKTTLLRCINFLETPDAGTIAVRGRTIFDAADPTHRTEAEIRKNRLHFGLVFQSFHLFPQYTAKRNVTLAAELLMKKRIKDRAEQKARLAALSREAETLLEQVGLADKLSLYPHQLSGGQQQRVAIARALAMHPDILCFDEPTSALDPELTGEVLRVLRRLAQKKTTMIVVTHEMEFAREVADRAIFMDGGLIAETGEAKALFANPQTPRLQSFLTRAKSQCGG